MRKSMAEDAEGPEAAESPPAAAGAGDGEDEDDMAAAARRSERWCAGPARWEKRGDLADAAAVARVRVRGERARLPPIAGASPSIR